MKKKFLTSESVTEGHPDKICDQISDAILDDLLKQDPYSRVAVECLATTGSIHIAGEVTTKGYCDVQKIARDTLRKIGYTNPKFGIDADDAGVWAAIHQQSPDISQGVDEKEGHEQGAGDQGMMYGYACIETDELMPLPIMLAHKLTKRMAQVRKEGIIPYLGPDGKSQVTIEYQEKIPKRLEAIVISQQHTKEISEKSLKELIEREVIQKIIPRSLIDERTKYHINPTGTFIIGGPEGDTGVTGRKIIVDTYGGVGKHGGGAFSGKDPTKVDRSGAYAARYIAKNIVASGLADVCEVQLSYAIGIAEPIEIDVDCLGTNKLSEELIVKWVREYFPLKPAEIIKRLDLRKPIYEKTACYGHFGRIEGEGFAWERECEEFMLKVLSETY
ncbi:MAG: methionine adenosyltransferase [Candidatus ainarchaeum sp.]|nr:methionine adenosyltransferase [Candidatus ainarchaeum sp.]